MGAANVVAVINGKGGVGKTTIAANVAGLAAHSGWRTLVVDLDQQANLARDLGYLDRSDGGAALYAAAFLGKPLERIFGVRTMLDVVAGGDDTRRFGDQVQMEFMRGDQSALDRLRGVIEALAGEYDAIFLDLPPGDAVVQQAALRAARWIVVPTTGDAAANDGLGAVYTQYRRAKEANPDLQVLGVVVTFVPIGASAMLREVRRDLEGMLQGQVTIFEPPIRTARRAAMDCRAKGLLAFEYEAAKAASLPWYEARRLGMRTERFAENAAGLAEDYQQLTEAILETIAAAGVEVPS